VLGHIHLALGALAHLCRTRLAMVTGVRDCHFMSLTFTHWAFAALRHVFITMVAVEHRGGFHLGHVHFAHGAFA